MWPLSPASMAAPAVLRRVRPAPGAGLGGRQLRLRPLPAAAVATGWQWRRGWPAGGGVKGGGGGLVEMAGRRGAATVRRLDSPLRQSPGTLDSRRVAARFDRTRTGVGVGFGRRVVE